MKPFSKLSTSSTSSRCAFTKGNGHRCRMLPAPDSTFCLAHTPKPNLAAELVRDLDQFHTAGDVTIFLSRLLGAASRGEISTRRASVLAYISISLMQALRSMAKESGHTDDGDTYDPIPLAWTIMHPGKADWVNIHDARAFFAQKRANELRKVAEESFAGCGRQSAYYPYAQIEQPASQPSTGSGDESPYVRFSRLSS